MNILQTKKVPVSRVLVDGRLLVNSIRNKEPQSELKADIRRPLCGSVMQLRKARKGPNTGNFCYGCSRYPGCKRVRDATAEAQLNSESVRKTPNDRSYILIYTGGAFRALLRIADGCFTLYLR
jgi:ssDNA-binding Zn-finger/Zn-ribbon topoisomerase 1